MKDLVDLAVFAPTSTIDGTALIAAVDGEWAHRGLAGRSAFVPPPQWESDFPKLARKTPACGEVTQFAAGIALVDALLAPVIDRTATGRTWQPASRTWIPTD